jgi:hypothetical protein
MMFSSFDERKGGRASAAHAVCVGPRPLTGSGDSVLRGGSDESGDCESDSDTSTNSILASLGK